MYLPLELLRLIVASAESELPWKDWLALRLVNSKIDDPIVKQKLKVQGEFEEEVITCLFTENRPDTYRRLINGKTLSSAPHSLRMRYINFRIGRHRAEPSLFAHLITPVIERYMKCMDKLDFEGEDRQAVQDQLLSFCVHDQDLAWVVAHKSSRFGRHLSRAVKYYRKSEEKLSPNQSFHQEQIERNCRFASLCMAISQNNHKSILRQLQPYATVTEKNLCFGKSILQIAMDFGDDETLEIVVRHSDRADDKNARALITTALSRQTEIDSERTIYLLLSFFTTYKSYGKTIGFLTKMIRTLSADHGCEGLTCVLGWINWNPEKEERTTLTEYALSLSIRSFDFEMIETVRGEVDMAAYPLQEAIEIMVHPPQPYDTVMRQEASVLELLVRMGANPNMVDVNRRGWLLSPLMYVAECERHRMMRVLLRAGADPESDGEKEGVSFWGHCDSRSDVTEKLVMEIKKMSAIEKEKDASRRFLH